MQLAEEKGVNLTELTVEELQSISDLFGGDVTAVFQIESALANRNVKGGTSPEALVNQVMAARTAVNRLPLTDY